MTARRTAIMAVTSLVFHLFIGFVPIDFSRINNKHLVFSSGTVVYLDHLNPEFESPPNPHMEPRFVLMGSARQPPTRKCAIFPPKSVLFFKS